MWRKKEKRKKHTQGWRKGWRKTHTPSEQDKKHTQGWRGLKSKANKEKVYEDHKEEKDPNEEGKEDNEEVLIFRNIRRPNGKVTECCFYKVRRKYTFVFVYTYNKHMPNIYVIYPFTRDADLLIAATNILMEATNIYVHI